MQKLLIFFALLVLAPITTLADTRTELSSAVFDQLDAGVFNAAVTTINASSGALVTVVASLADSAAFCRVWDSTGKFIGVYEGSTLRFISVPGMDSIIRCPFAKNSLVKLRNMENTSITSGKLVIQFMR